MLSSHIARVYRFFRNGGVPRDDIRPTLRITNYKKRTVIAFSVSAETVAIIGIFYGGQDYVATLQSELDND